MSEVDGTRFSLPSGEGAGALLCLAAADTAGGGSPAAYSCSTQQAVVLAYHLLRHGTLDREALAAEFVEMDGDDQEPTVYRAPSADFTTWLESVRAGQAVLATEASNEPAVRVAPVGMWFRRQPDALVDAALETARLTHLDGPSAVATAAAAGAVAASCFAQNGRDLLMAVAEVAQQAATTIESEAFRYSRADQTAEVVDQIRHAVTLVGRSAGDVRSEFGAEPVAMVVATMAMAAPATGEPHLLIEDALAYGGSPMGALAGAIVGARVGIRVWPWSFPNDTWFVALGQRLISGSAELADLPVPFAVEQRITYAAQNQLM